MRKPACSLQSHLFFSARFNRWLVLLLLLSFSIKGQPESGSCERQHPIGVGSKNFEGRRRTSKDVLSRRFQPGASPRPVFDFLGLLFAKETQLVCVEVEEIGVSFQQRSGTGSNSHKEDRICKIAHCFAVFRQGQHAIHLSCPRICWLWTGERNRADA